MNCDYFPAKASFYRRLCFALLCTPALSPSLAGADTAVPPEELFPMIFRVGEEAFNEGRGPVEERSEVETCVLGTQNRGHAVVQGQVLVDLVNSPLHASLRLTFQGKSTSHTQGRQGPVTVHSTTVSPFDCQSIIKFDEEGGFTAGRSDVRVSIESMRRRIATESGGLRGRIVRSVAKKRIAEKEGQIRNIALTTTRERLSESMDRRVEARTSAWNAHWNELREALRQQRWYVDLPRPFFASSDHELLVMLALDPGPAAQASVTGVQATALPRRRPEVVADLLLHQAWLAEQNESDSVFSFLTETPETLVLMMASELLLRVESRTEGGWLIFEFYPSEQDSASTAVATEAAGRNEQKSPPGTLTSRR